MIHKNRNVSSVAIIISKKEQVIHRIGTGQFTRSPVVHQKYFIKRYLSFNYLSNPGPLLV